MDEQRENKLDIEIDPNVAEGVYSNLAVISHSGTILCFLIRELNKKFGRITKTSFPLL